MLKKASDLVPCGVYAIERDGCIEILNLPMLPADIKRFRRDVKGVRIYANE